MSPPVAVRELAAQLTDEDRRTHARHNAQRAVNINPAF